MVVFVGSSQGYSAKISQGWTSRQVVNVLDLGHVQTHVPNNKLHVQREERRGGGYYYVFLPYTH